jgi:IS1 family transposase
MSKLTYEQKATVLSLLCEGNSIRSAERITGIHRDTIMRLTVSAGEQAQSIMDKRLQNLQCKVVQCDEIWAFLGKKQKKVKPEDNPIFGDQWIFIALDAESKLVISQFVGKRTTELTDRLMYDLAKKIKGEFQLSTDAFNAYPASVYRALGGDVHYGQVVKTYAANTPEDQRRYSPQKIVSVTIRAIMGRPDPKLISTSYIERQNLTVRMQSRRLTRLTNAFSKKYENLVAAMALHFFHYNFMRIHSSVRCTPAMAAGVTRSIWNWEDLFEGDRTYAVAA